ncbi:MAG: nucleotidyltransferase domain-containing protein [Nitrososphaerota archaeon]|nr:nucleotidyltransferase domain-containing protein [Nitrososphaerota archaeon]MDG6990750.1 nucleotidyltransferase domain-containing protein [Nitrososphaerota archaeon]
MRWVPSWLGLLYAQIYARFGHAEFTTEEAKEAGGSSTNLNLALSRLASAGWIVRTKRGRYVAVEPLAALSGLANGWSDRFRDRTVFPCLEVAVGELFGLYGDRLVSLALFGSCARLDEGKTSDIDLLAVARGVSDGYADRLKELRRVKDATSRLRARQWLESGEFHLVDVTVLKVDELAANDVFLLDLTQDAVVIFDRDDTLKLALERVRGRLRESRSRRVAAPSGSWYWELEPVPAERRRAHPP